MNIKNIIKQATHILPDRQYLKLRYFMQFKKPLDLNNPLTFNQKLQWLKLYNRKPEYTRMVDKYEAKKFVAERIGEEHIIPTLGVWEHFDDIDFDALPEKFVLKCTHDSGGLVICTDKAALDKEAARKKIEGSLANNYYWDYREWQYKDVKPRIIAEVFVESGAEGVPHDYKVMCFNGTPKLIELHQGRYANHTQDFYDTQWNKQAIEQVGERMSDTLVPKPQRLEEMLSLSAQLSRDIPHLRVDWYHTEEQLFFGELTFYDGAGLFPFVEEKYDRMLGDWIQLPEKKK